MAPNPPISKSAPKPTACPPPTKRSQRLKKKKLKALDIQNDKDILFINFLTSEDIITSAKGVAALSLRKPQ